MNAALATTEAIVHCMDGGHVQLPRLLHAERQALVWPMLDFALQRGYDTRIGLEDTLMLADGSQAKDNAELVSLAVNKARQW